MFIRAFHDWEMEAISFLFLKLGNVKIKIREKDKTCWKLTMVVF